MSISFAALMGLVGAVAGPTTFGLVWPQNLAPMIEGEACLPNYVKGVRVNDPPKVDESKGLFCQRWHMGSQKILSGIWVDVSLDTRPHRGIIRLAKEPSADIGWIEVDGIGNQGESGERHHGVSWSLAGVFDEQGHSDMPSFRDVHTAGLYRYISAELTPRGTLRDFVRLDHLIGGPASVLHGIQRGFQGSLDVNDTQYRDEQRNARKDRREQRAIGGALLCAQILFVVGSLCGGFYILAHTLENSRRLSTDTSTLRALLSSGLILSGGIVMALAFGAVQSP